MSLPRSAPGYTPPDARILAIFVTPVPDHRIFLVAGLFSVFCVGLGAALGGLCRYGVCALALAWKLPWLGTLLVNVVGCFLAGLAFALLLRYPHTGAWAQPLVMIGFLGSLTTFSAFGLDSLGFLLRSDIAALVGNALANTLLGVAATLAGYLLFRPG